MNDELKSLKGLDNIDPASIEALWLYDLPSIEFCPVKSICEYLKNPSPNDVIRDNRFGCNTAEQILENCKTVSSIEIDQQNGISPNPTFGILDINYKNYNAVMLYSNFGIELKEWNHPVTSIDISYLNSGMYFLAIQKEGGTIVEKVIKH